MLVLLSVDEYLKLIHSYVFSITVMVKAHPNFNVIAHFLAQCGSEPWSTTITASAPTCTPLWVPQRVIKVPLVFPCSNVRWLTKILLSHKWRCSWTRIRGTGAVAAGVAVVFGIPYCKGPDVVSRRAMSHRQTWNIGAVQSSLTSIVVAVECRCSIVLVSSSSSTDLSVGYPMCWKGDWGAATIARMWTGTHMCEVDDSVGQPLRTGIADISHINKSCPHPSSSDVTTIVGFHLAVCLRWSSSSFDPVVPRWSSGVAVIDLLAGGGRVVFRVS